MTDEPEQPKKPALPAPLPRKQGLRRFNPKYALAETGPSGGTSYVIKPAGIEAVTRMAREGHDVVSIAATLGISPDTFKRICRRQPEVQEALDEGRATLGDEITDILLTKARKGETAAAIFLAKGRLGWREVGPTDPNQQAGPSVNITITAPMGDDEWQRMVKVGQQRAINGTDDEGRE